MGPLGVLAQPRRALAFLTLIGAAVAGVAAWAWSSGDTVPTATVLLVPVVLLAAFATRQSGKRGWTYLVVAWALCFVAYGAMPPIPVD